MECQLFRICWLGYGKPAPSHKNRRFHNLQIMWTCSKEVRAPFQFRPACAPGARPSPEDRAPVSIRLFPPSVLPGLPATERWRRGTGAGNKLSPSDGAHQLTPLRLPLFQPRPESPKASKPVFVTATVSSSLM